MILLVILGALVCLVIFLAFVFFVEVLKLAGPVAVLVLGFLCVMMIPLNQWREKLIIADIEADIDREFRKPFYDLCFNRPEVRSSRETRTAKQVDYTSFGSKCPYAQARYLKDGWFRGTFYPYFWPSAWTPWTMRRQLPVPRY